MKTLLEITVKLTLEQANAILMALSQGKLADTISAFLAVKQQADEQVKTYELGAAIP